ncbi:hypothetical protein SAMN06265182_1741 [Persephonella hydrogeniphila]|uniref:Uncharacterized protein n=1 Tax=Persephonella hydrogeniphila TaxID=198703 RepID=A0A285NKY2_9AQUI|nr:hypothetical protein [Persephonella hydrogeniphila]SNZ10119.1 hypothetical protein SAMN06265182_1741 [Persephonella hydrogeniphila]
MLVNRFPKMAALQKYRALRLGYPEDLAEAIGIAEALKYAIFKRLAHSERRYREEEEKRKKKEIQSLDWERFKIFKLASYNGWPYVAGKVETPEEYRKNVFWRFGEEGGKKIEEWAEKIIQKVPEDYLKNEQKFFREVWVPNRDEPIEV